MADNCLMSLEPWTFRSSSSFNDSLWSLTDSFNRDTDALTRALQISLSDDSGSPHDTRPTPKPVTRNPLPCSPSSARISKRKSRASKKTPTTYITADPANFRQMVQQVTGVRFGEAPVEALVRPEPQRVGLGAATAVACLPTLDTSAVLLDRARMVGSVGPAEGTGSGFEFDGFASFPTLESWAAM